MGDPKPRKVAIIGGGVIGGGWAARFLLNGFDVAVYDPAPQAPRQIGEVLDNARRALPAIYDRALPEEGLLRFCDTLEDAVSGAEWVQESVPERLELKHSVHAAIAAAAPENAVIGSSTSGFKPSELNSRGAGAIVAHPFNPVYLLPLVELVGAAGACARAADILQEIGMYPLIVRKEIDAHIADRLLEAIWRESLWLVKDGIASTKDIDEAIRMGFGLRFAQMGLFETYRIAGGEAGMKHFLAQFGPALAWPWTKLTDVPDYDDALVDLISGQSDVQSGDLPIRQLERRRDDNLVAILRALRVNGDAAGKVIGEHEKMFPLESMLEGLPVTARRRVPSTWTDYNGHMNETFYLEAGSKATDGFMELIGADSDYIAGGLSYFTVESHVRHLNEVHSGDMLTVTTQVLTGQGKKMHLFHRLHRGDGELAATVETLLLHMNLNTRATCLPELAVAQKLSGYAVEHAGLKAEGSGRFVGERKADIAPPPSVRAMSGEG
ncbi:carnitine 3-dehydrogenase [Breoghania corrubedonensis]|uniref:L-carnitine dehydrogenase n=1 Tax=Breoghania corrubedonensis TaxID=665038 RepID=A0A2T5US73_9HYPH|nr:carnitine 3-dehydrogenase [Breoghania corrubedonensis]PTW54369.1 carnitine 3-dehydrogenase [Breoghania corrubedonensis]